MPPTDDTDDFRRKSAHAEAVIAELRGAVAELRNQVEAQQARIHRLVKITFGRGGERVEGPTLFDGMAVPGASTPAEPSAREVTPATKRKCHGRRRKPKDLPRRREEIGLNEAEKVCGCCGTVKVRVGQCVSERLDYRPMAIFVRDTIDREGAILLRPPARSAFQVRNLDRTQTARSDTTPPSIILKLPSRLVAAVKYRLSSTPIGRLAVPGRREGGEVSAIRPRPPPDPLGTVSQSDDMAAIYPLTLRPRLIDPIGGPAVSQSPYRATASRSRPESGRGGPPSDAAGPERPGALAELLAEELVDVPGVGEPGPPGDGVQRQVRLGQQLPQPGQLDPEDFRLR